MPAYAFLAERKLSANDIELNLKANRKVGVPYSEEMIAAAKSDLRVQADPNGDTSGLLARYPGAAIVEPAQGPGTLSEMDALVAYLQVLGTQVKFRDLPPGALKQ
jgi:cytochrome c oxidase cbb3-type subunit 2